MYDFEVLEVEDPKWEEIIKKCYIHDFHHSPFYHKIDNQNRSVLFLANDGQDFIAMPLIVRPIDGEGLFDLTSVYGYCGPISNRADFNFAPDFLLFFKERFDNYCFENKIICAFSRLHPLIEHNTVFENFGDVHYMNKTVSINLIASEEEQRKQYRKSNKSEINQLRKKGFVVRNSVEFSDIERFVDIYYETMDRVKASTQYYFSRDYFHSFLKNTHFGSYLLIAEYNGIIVAGAIFTVTNKIMQYHLAGTKEEFIQLTPMKLILDEARLLGNSLGLEFLHLGGGVGGSDDDSLFRFKAGFSKVWKQFAIWKYIVDKERYDFLVEKSNIRNKLSDFFPLYRS